MPYSELTALLEWLDAKALAVRILEEKAEAALHDHNDQARYRQLMLEKATILSNLADEGTPLVALLPESHRGTISERLARFSQSATMAKRVGSVFYMSALLYPEDHRKGDPNDLEAFIGTLRANDE